MESETVSRQQSPLLTPASVPTAGACTMEEDAPDESDGSDASDPTAAMLSRLSFCIAWLFGLEAFLAEPGERSHAPRGTRA